MRFPPAAPGLRGGRRVLFPTAALRPGVNEQDFHKLAQDHYDRLFRAARFMCGSDDAAEDLVHETFLAAAQSYGRFQHRSSTYTWLYGIMLNKFRRWVRKKRGRVLSLQRPAEEGDARSAEQVLEAEGDEPPIEAERREAIALVREAV